MSALGAEAARLLCSGDLATLAARFGYALAQGRELETAIRQDLTQCLAEVGAVSLNPARENSTSTVKYLEPNDSNLLAVIECLVDTNNGSELMVELVVTGSDADTHVTLEQISVFGKGS